MARDHARVSLSVWADDDWRDLSPGAQHLYFVLLTQPTLSYAGVADWRPARIRALASQWTGGIFDRAARELATNLYIVVDEETEEVMIRSFVRHDGLMKQRNMAVSMVRAYEATASKGIRGVFVHELARLREDEPELAGWVSCAHLLENRSFDPADYPTGYPGNDHEVDPSIDPSVEGQPTGEPSPSVDGCPTPTPSPTPSPHSLLHAPAAQGTAKPRERGGYSDEFETFWATYPRKEAKRQAWKAWGKALERATPEQITAGAHRYASDPNRSEQFTKHGATWLNADGWEDEPLPSTSGRDNTHAAWSTPKGYDPADWLRKPDEPSLDFIDAEVVQLREIGR